MYKDIQKMCRTIGCRKESNTFVIDTKASSIIIYLLFSSFLVNIYTVDFYGVAKKLQSSSTFKERNFTPYL